jgi:tRNA uridine 5-carbamoylmethylation protein Kti12
LTVECISLDEIERGGLSGDDYQFSASVWQQSRQLARMKVTELRTHCGDSTCVHRLLILDDNFFYKSMRKQFRPNGIIFLSRALQDCMKLNAQRSFKIPAHIIESMALSMEVPEPTLECPVLTICPSVDESVDELCQFVESSFDFWAQVLQSATAPAITSEEGNLSTRELLLNECENRLRKCISLVACENRLSKESMKRISDMKSEAMQHCKSTITNDTSSETGSEILDSLILKFSLAISSIR